MTKPMEFVKTGSINIAVRLFRNRKQVQVSSLDPKAPTLITLHGGPGISDHSLLVPFWSRFSDTIQVLFYDQRGNGLTQCKGEDKTKWTIKQCAIDLENLISTLELKRVIIYGLSWGGYVAIQHSILYPNRAEQLWLSNTEAKVDPFARKEKFISLAVVFGRSTEEAELAGEAVWHYDHHPEDPNAAKKFFSTCMPFYAKNPYSPDELSRVITNPEMREMFMKEENLTFDFRSDLWRMRKNLPILYFAGKDDGAHPLRCAKETADLMNGHVTFIAVAGGSPVYRDSGLEVEEIIRSYLGEHLDAAIASTKARLS